MRWAICGMIYSRTAESANAGLPTGRVVVVGVLAVAAGTTIPSMMASIAQPMRPAVVVLAVARMVGAVAAAVGVPVARVVVAVAVVIELDRLQLCT